jgi:uncharacterized protein
MRHLLSLTACAWPRPARGRSAVLSLLLLVCLYGTASSQTPPDRSAPIRALYVTGGGFHDFVAQEAIVPPGIAERIHIDWTVDHTAGTSTDVLIDRHQDTSWTQAFQVVVYNMSFSHVVDADWIERLARAHRDSGVHAVILHGAVHSYRRSETRAWGELMGAFSMRHDRQRPLTIEVLAPGHPVMRGFPDTWKTIDEELYEIERTWPSMTPLAQAYSVESEKQHPVIWTNTHGKARAFVTTLGHNNAMMSNPVYLDLVTRGLLWTMDLLQDDGTPAPGYGKR